jgi:hypothetical protein
MSSAPHTPACYIGWDVGGWNCDKNGNSRDAIVILDAQLGMVGEPWRGNLRTSINTATTSEDWVRVLFALCGVTSLPTGARITLAVDTPLGFSQAFVALVTGKGCVEGIETSATNPYLFRQTEQELFRQGLRPLSAIKDMIGSQATKGMHVLAKFAPKVTRCGVWTDGNAFTVFEAYPSPCKESNLIKGLRKRCVDAEQAKHSDEVDALTCALIAYCFEVQPTMLFEPGTDIPASEGWIWVPKDTLIPRRVL